VNPAKAKRPQVAQALRELGWDGDETPHSPWGLRLHGKPRLTQSEPFEKGWIEVQDEGSQLLALLVDARRGEMVADFCAGAGGKALAMAAQMRGQGRVYAFDTSSHRLDALAPRAQRAGVANLYPLAIAHEADERLKTLAGKMDRVLVDAPCTGLGTLRRSPDRKWRLSEEDAARYPELQARILAAAARLVKPGGRLVYATCSLLHEENEDVARAFSAAHADFEPVAVRDLLLKAKVAQAEDLTRDAASPNAASESEGGTGQCLRLWPHRHGTDGFFAAVWQRR
jgi:16S rRNA (cytosine967-C5)-methyltransferase